MVFKKSALVPRCRKSKKTFKSALNREIFRRKKWYLYKTESFFITCYLMRYSLGRLKSTFWESYYIGWLFFSDAAWPSYIMILAQFFLAPSSWQEFLGSLFFETAIRPLIRLWFVIFFAPATLPLTARFFHDFFFFSRLRHSEYFRHTIFTSIVRALIISWRCLFFSSSSAAYYGPVL